MRELVLKKIKVKLFEEIDELPIDQYNLMNEYALQDHQIGNTMADVEKRYNALATFLVNKKSDEAIKEVHSLYQTHYSMINHLNYKSLQFACFIHSIDGVRMEDYSMGNLAMTLTRLSKAGLSMRMVKDIIEDLKKKSRNNLD